MVWPLADGVRPLPIAREVRSMARRLRSVDLDFVPVAPLRLVFAAEVSAPPEVVLATAVLGFAKPGVNA